MRHRGSPPGGRSAQCGPIVGDAQRRGGRRGPATTPEFTVEGPLVFCNRSSWNTSVARRPAWRGATREPTGSIRPRSNTARRDAPSRNCFANHCYRTLDPVEIPRGEPLRESAWSSIHAALLTHAQRPSAPRSTMTSALPRRMRSDGLETVNVRTSRGTTVPVTTPYYREKHARRAKRRPGLYPALVVLGIYDRCTPRGRHAQLAGGSAGAAPLRRHRPGYQDPPLDRLSLRCAGPSGPAERGGRSAWTA